MATGSVDTVPRWTRRLGERWCRDFFLCCGVRMWKGGRMIGVSEGWKKDFYAIGNSIAWGFGRSYIV